MANHIGKDRKWRIWVPSTCLHLIVLPGGKVLGDYGYESDLNLFNIPRQARGLEKSIRRHHMFLYPSMLEGTKIQRFMHFNVFS